MGRGWTSGRIGLASILAGCAPAPAAAPLVRLDLADGFVACEGQQDHLAAYVLAASELFDEPPHEHPTLTLHVAEQVEIERKCSGDVGGCAFDGEAWSNGAADHHELTHLVMHELAPRAVAAFGEGIAEALGTSQPYWPESTPRLPLASYATKPTAALGSSERVAAALYATFLLDEFGPLTYLELYSALPYGSSVDEVDARMREHLGASLDELDARFADPTEARCMLALSHCGDVYGPVLDPPFEVEHSLTCDEPGALGYEADDGSSSPFRRWQAIIPRSGTYRVEVEGAPVFGLRCGACDERRPPIPFHNALGMKDGVDFELEAGLYTFEVIQLLDDHETFRIALHEVG